MKQYQKLILLVVIFAAALFAGYQYFFKTRLVDIVEENTAEPFLAWFDRNGNKSPAPPGEYKHIRIRWNTTGGDGLLEKFKKISAQSQPLLITLEIWPALSDKLSTTNVLSIIAGGAYDEKIKKLALHLNQQDKTIMIRLNPEMEVYVNRYPWQMQWPDLYTKAFRHFAALLKKNAPAVKMVWAPAGYPGTEEYWPGKEWVDMVSVTLQSESERMTNNYPEEKSMQQLIFRKLHRLRFFDKPALVMGSNVITKQNFQQAAFDAAVQYIRENSEIEFSDISAAGNKPDSSLQRKKGALLLGIFDPFNKLVNSVPVSTEHFFVNLNALKSGIFKSKADSAVKRNHDLIVTMEPWRDKQLDKDPLLMKHILSGNYDSVFNLLYTVIAGTHKKVYLRWLHEMEIPITRYPWQSQDPLQYIKAYRYFVNFIRNKNPSNVFFVWGPAGDRGSMEFWPGSDVVDYTSIAIYGLPDKNITDHNKQESFSTIFNRKYRRIGFANKPLFITEFGVKGPAKYKHHWLTDAAACIESNPSVFGVSYFNDADNPKAWGDIEAPDWSITPEMFTRFRAQLKTSLRQ